MWYYIIIFILCAVFGFLYGKKMHLNQLAKVLYTSKMIPEQSIDKVVDLVASYNKIRREARKATKEAYKKVLVAESLEKIKKEDTTSNG